MIDNEYIFININILTNYFKNFDFYHGNSIIENINNLPQVNHINGIKNDNRIENLEVVTNLQNSQDKDMDKIKGYNFHKNGCPKPYEFQFMSNGKRYSKCFSNIDEGRKWLLTERRKYCYMTD